MFAQDKLKMATTLQAHAASPKAFGPSITFFSFCLPIITPVGIFLSVGLCLQSGHHNGKWLGVERSTSSSISKHPVTSTAASRKASFALHFLFFDRVKPWKRPQCSPRGVQTVYFYWARLLGTPTASKTCPSLQQTSTVQPSGPGTWIAVTTQSTKMPIYRPGILQGRQQPTWSSVSLSACTTTINCKTPC